MITKITEDKRKLIVDNFAGGGGASTGIWMAVGRHVDIAVNHDRDALGMHEINHPSTRHMCEDVWQVNPRIVTNGRVVGAAWFSPDCKDHSKAKGGKPRSKKIRGLAWVMMKWVGKLNKNSEVGLERLFMENVEEFQEFGPLVAMRDKATGRVMKMDDTVAAPGEVVPIRMQKLHRDPRWRDRHGPIRGRNFYRLVRLLREKGGNVEWRERRACNAGAGTIRKRLYIIARFDGKPIVWPDPTHGAPDSAGVKSGHLKPYRTAAESIDWSVPCRSIFLSKDEARQFKVKRPLAEVSNRRIAKGVERYVMKTNRPFLVDLNKAANMITIGYGEKKGQLPRIQNIEKPITTVTAQGVKHALVENSLAAPLIVRQFGTGIGHSVDEPIRTTMADGGVKSQNVMCYLSQNNEGNIGRGLDEPISTLMGTCSHQTLVAASIATQYGTLQATDIEEPLPTATTKDRFLFTESYLAVPPLTEELAVKARVVAAFLRKYGVEFEGEFATTKSGLVIYDIGLRMLQPRELFNAQGFPPEYCIDKAVYHNPDGSSYVKALSKHAQVRMCGNSVCPPEAYALIAANCPDMVATEAEVAA